MATSGDTRCYRLHDEARYPHVLESGTGWPVLGGLRVVTAASDDCTEAGVLSMLALPHRREAEPFSREFGAACRVIR